MKTFPEFIKAMGFKAPFPPGTAALYQEYKRLHLELFGKKEADSA